MSAMAREIDECAEAVARLAARGARFASLARTLANAKAPLAIVCGRGSSGHAGVHLRYLIETRLGLPVSASAPSVFTSLQRELRLPGVPFFVISQSGRSPDLVEATKAAGRAGAITVAIVNDPASPVAEAADCVLDLEAGPEISVAATKSVVASMAAGAWLVATMAGDDALLAALQRLPDRLARAARLDWPALRDALHHARFAYVTGRGFGLGPAREIALKMAETLRLPSLAYSSAELLHGPRAAIAEGMPVLALRVTDATAASVDLLADNLRMSGLAPFVCGGAGSSLAWIGDDHAAVDAIAMLVPAYRCIEQAAQAAGFDPDCPPHLAKITETF
jgi:glutamine---fructose-6-phosphate transaminase (isomerizing)